MEKKLAEYRAKKDRDERLKKLQNKVNELYNKYFKPTNHTVSTKTELEINEPQEEIYTSLGYNIENNNPHSEVLSRRLTRMLPWFVLWCTVYWLFIKLEFGIVFLITSGLIGIFLNTRTGPRNPNEISAYSVFNRNCKSIDGTLNAEQFEREIRYGAGSTR